MKIIACIIGMTIFGLLLGAFLVLAFIVDSLADLPPDEDHRPPL